MTETSTNMIAVAVLAASLGAWVGTVAGTWRRRTPRSAMQIAVETHRQRWVALQLGASIWKGRLEATDDGVFELQFTDGRRVYLRGEPSDIAFITEADDAAALHAQWSEHCAKAAREARH